MQPDQKLEREVAAVCELPREELVALWVKTYGCPPPKGIKRGLLERSAAWHLQAKRLGGLSTHARRSIRQYAKQKEAERGSAGALVPSELANTSPDGGPSGITASSARAATKAPPAPGTRLMREWNGRMHVVDITEDGILFDGTLYLSLTAVARCITDTHWSGPRFFGL